MYSVAVIGPLYMAYPNSCRHKFTFLPRLRPYPVRSEGALALDWQLLCFWQLHDCKAYRVQHDLWELSIHIYCV